MGVYIVFMAKENTHPDPFVDVNRLKIDDVIEVLPDIHQFVGTDDFVNTAFRIVHAVNLTIDDCASFVVPEPETDPQNPNPIPQRRGFKLDRTNPGITQAFLDFLNDDTRATQIYTTTVPAAALLSMKVAKPTRRGEVQL